MKQWCAKCSRYTDWTSGGCSSCSIGFNKPQIPSCIHEQAVPGDINCPTCGKKLIYEYKIISFNRYIVELK